MIRYTYESRMKTETVSPIYAWFLRSIFYIVPLKTQFLRSLWHFV